MFRVVTFKIGERFPSPYYTRGDPEFEIRRLSDGGARRAGRVLADPDHDRPIGLDGSHAQPS